MTDQQGNAPHPAQTLDAPKHATILGEEELGSSFGRDLPVPSTFAVEPESAIGMKEDDAALAARALQLRESLSRCDNNGGEGPSCPQDIFVASGLQTEVHLTNAELKQLQLRVIALENLVTALLAQASEGQLELASALAAYITPKQGSTPHHLTIHAARQMKHLISRAGVLKAMPPS